MLLPTGVLLLALGLWHPRSATGELDSAVGGPVPHPVSRLVPANHRSTDAERQECRVRLGSNYDAQLVVVADNLAQRPAALRSIAMEPNDLPIDDLVAVSTYLHGPPTGLDRALRIGAAESHRAVIACLTSGLRRFPFHHGACYSVARQVGVPADAYLPGRTIVEPAFIRTDTQASPCRLASPAVDDTEIVFAFWSRTGREVGAFGAGSATVIFTAGTSFQVLGVRPAAAGGGPAVVFLSESPRTPGLGSNRTLVRAGLGQRRILAQLRRQLAIGSSESGSPPSGGRRAARTQPRPLPVLGFTPGFDDTGRPYREELPHAP